MTPLDAGVAPHSRAPTAAVLSFRLGVADGVSVAAAQWVAALRRLGCRVRTVAGAVVSGEQCYNTVRHSRPRVDLVGRGKAWEVPGGRRGPEPVGIGSVVDPNHGIDGILGAQGSAQLAALVVSRRANRSLR